MPKRLQYRPEPGADLSVEQLQATARYLGYQLVLTWPPHYSASLYDCRTGNIEARGDDAFEHLRSIYPELKTSEGV